MKDLKGIVRRGKLAILFPLFALGLLVACADHHRVASRLVELDSLVDACPDSALAILDTLGKEGFDEFNRMYLELLRGKAMNKAFVKFTSGSAMLEVAHYFDRHGDANQRMLAHYVLGCAYRDMGSAPRALEQYQQATAQADTSSSACDLSTLMRVHSQMVLLYRSQNLIEEEFEETRKAQAIAYKQKDTLSALLFEERICNIFLTQKKYSLCDSISEHLYHSYSSLGYKAQAALSCMNRIKSCFAQKDFVNAKKYLDIYESCPFLYSDTNKIEGGAEPFYLYKGQYHLETGNLDSAEICFRKVHNDRPFMYTDLNAALGLCKIFELQQQPDSLFKYANLYMVSLQKKNERIKTEESIHVKSLYNYSSEQKMAERAQKRSALLRMVILWLSSLALLVIVILLYRHRQKQKELERLKKKIATSTIRLKDSECQLQELIAQHNEKEQEIEQAKERINALLTEQASVRQEADNIQSEKERIVSMLTDVQGQVDRLLKERKDIQSAISSQEREIEGVRWQANYLQEELRKRDDKDYSNLIQQKEEIVSVFQDALLDFKHKTITDNDWGKLRHVLESMYPTFHSTLYARENLSETEYQICLLVKAGFNTYEINTIMGKSSSYASVLRGRLLAKVFGVEGSPHQFDERIRLIGNPTIPTP